jgi:hypothetical protein
MRFALLVLLGAPACAGHIGGEHDNEAPAGPVLGDEGGLGVSDARRLTRLEYERTLRELFGDPAIDGIHAALDSVPSDRIGHDFSTLQRGVTSNHVDGYFTVADALSERLVSDPSALGELEPCLAQPSIDDACIDTMVGELGQRVLRRPPTEAERADLLAAWADGRAISTADGIKAVLLVLLQAPGFLYRLELDGDALADIPDAFTLTPFELATRLSYFAWGSSPDEELYALAQTGTLGDEDVWSAQVDRMFDDARARSWVASFAIEWLEADRLPGVQQPDAFLAGLAPEGLASAMTAELGGFIDYEVFEAKGSFRELCTSSVGVLASAPVASIYGVSAPADPNAPVSLPPEQRSGLLTRAALLLGADVETHPVKRGAFVRRKLLCDPIQPPDPTQFPPNTIVPPAFDPEKSARQRWTEKTSAPACASCHQRINAIGFVLENYDAIGRWRDVEPILDPATGAQVNAIPIDADVDVELDPAAPVHAAGPAALGSALADSAQARSCFARQWFQFVYGRKDSSEDSVTIEKLAVTASEPSGSMLEMFKQVASTPQFRLRRVKP